MGHVATSIFFLLYVVYISYESGGGLSQQLLFALDSQMCAYSDRPYWGLLRPLCPGFLERVDLKRNQRPLQKPAQLRYKGGQ